MQITHTFRFNSLSVILNAQIMALLKFLYHTDIELNGHRRTILQPFQWSKVDTPNTNETKIEIDGIGITMTIVGDYIGIRWLEIMNEESLEIMLKTININSPHFIKQSRATIEKIINSKKSIIRKIIT